MYRYVVLSSLTLLTAACLPTGTERPPPPPEAPAEPGEKIELAQVYSAGITATNGPGCMATDGTAVLRFAMRGFRDEVITQRTLEDVDDTFPADTIRFADNALFEPGNLQCEPGACSSDDWTCNPPPGASTPDWQQCYIPGDELITSTGDPVFVSRTDRNQLFGVMLEFTNSWRGSLPETITNLNPDFDEDGRGDAGASLVLQNSDSTRATDPRGARFSLLDSMQTRWNDIRQNAMQRHTTETFFGLWTFGSSGASVFSRVARLDSTPEGTEFVSSNGRAAAAVANVSINGGNPEQAAVFESMIAVLESPNGYASPEFAEAEKVLTVVVDGPDELRLPHTDVDDVIAAAQAVGARVFIVHVDTPVQTTGINTSTDDEIPLFPADPTYYASQAGFASQDACDCKNFEACRTVTSYSYEPGNTTSIPDDSNTLYCVPDRDQNGRLGPIADYERIACATGGGYIYVPDSGRLVEQADWLPYTLYGLWELPVDVDLPGPDPDAYMLQTDLVVRLGGFDETFSHTHDFNPNQPGDSRIVLFSK